MTEAEAEAVDGAGYVGLVLEWADLEALHVDVEAGTVPELMGWCVAALTELAPDPSHVTLVVTGDFVASVHSRLGPDRRQAYDLERGSGFVGGKTMLRPDGGLDVLLHAWWFGEVEEEFRERTAQLVKRTLVHEAQHVAMAQQEREHTIADGTGRIMTNLLSGADSVLGEYRAELGVGPTLRDGELVWDALLVLEALRSDLARVVNDYQEHLDVGRLVLDVGTVGLVGWRGLAYMAAAGRVMGNGQIPAEVTADPLWVRMAARHWDAFAEALAAAEPGTVRMGRDDLDAVVADLAGVLGEWLVDLGFEWTDYPGGNSLFKVVEWDLLDPAFIRAEERPDEG